GNVGDGGAKSTSTSTTLAVTPTNDAPVLDADESPTLTIVQEDAGGPANGSTAGSTLVSALLAGVSDVDVGAQQGVAVTGVSQGALWYSLDDGETWAMAGAVSASNALLLAADAR